MKNGPRWLDLKMNWIFYGKYQWCQHLGRSHYKEDFAKILVES
jgi:hypothetical protein